MFKVIILVLFFLNGSLSLAKKSNSKRPKAEFKGLLDEAVEDSEKETSIEISEEKEKEPPTLLESVSNTEKVKNLIQRELAKSYNFELGTPVDEDIEKNEDQKSISFGDVELQISKRPEEILVKKKASNRNKNILMIKSKRGRGISSKK